MNNDKRKNIRVCRAAKALLLGGLVAMTCACNDFLNIYPTDKVVLEDYWKSKDDVESVVAESYRLMTQSSFTYRLLAWGELRGDNVREGNNTPTDVKDILNANLLPSNSYATWDIFYKVINNCNIVLKYAPGVLNEDPSFTQGDLDVVCGQMYAIRALCHFYLVRAFRDIPLLTEAMVDNSQNLYQKQVSPIEALECCLSDLKMAEDLVLASGNYPSNAANKGRITKDAVRAMIADVHLWKAAFLTYNAKGDGTVATEDYDSCSVYCDKVLDARRTYVEIKLKENKVVFSPNELHSVENGEEYFPILYPSESNGGYGKTTRLPHRPYLNSFANGGNSMCESIFEIQHTSERDGTVNYEVPYFFGSSTDGKNFNVGVLSATSHLALPTGIYGSLDFRRVNNVFAQSDDLKDYGIIKYGHSSSSEARDAGTSGFVFGKVSYTFLENDGKSFLTNTNWVVYRISDVMLMKAEALVLRNIGFEQDVNSNSDLDYAVNLVRTIYNRSQTGYLKGEVSTGIVPVGIDVADLEEFKKRYHFDNIFKFAEAKDVLRLILDERQREFAFEGKRWFDLVRWALRSEDGTPKDMLDIMIPNKYTTLPNQYRAKMSTINSLFFPIAEREINANPLLKQNEAYKKDSSVEKN